MRGCVDWLYDTAERPDKDTAKAIVPATNKPGRDLKRDRGVTPSLRLPIQELLTARCIQSSLFCTRDDPRGCSDCVHGAISPVGRYGRQVNSLIIALDDGYWREIQYLQ
jgi:hypothetical protein